MKCSSVKEKKYFLFCLLGRKNPFTKSLSFKKKGAKK